MLKIIEHEYKNIAPSPIVFVHPLLKRSSLIKGWSSWQHKYLLVLDMGQFLKIENDSQVSELVFVV